jgi:hypothetical protein
VAFSQEDATLHALQKVYVYSENALGIMLRVNFLQQWFALSDPAAEDALHESVVPRRFLGDP